MPNQERIQGFAEKIADFLRKQEEDKLKNTGEEDRAEKSRKFQPGIWLEGAAGRAGRLSAVTHTVKPMHPDAKSRGLFCGPGQLKPNPFIGSHLLGPGFSLDVEGDAAALDVYKFLNLEYEGKSLLGWLMAEDADALAALSPDPEKSRSLAKSFCDVMTPDSPATHTLAKQLYWLAGEDPGKNDSFQLLAPLHPSSLAHEMYLAIQADCFGEAIKEARKARREKTWHDREVRDYLNLAAQKFGGTKPQNISQLNAERKGANYLLSSLPPNCKSRPVRPPRGDSIFRAFRWRPDAYRPLLALRKFLESDPPRIKDTRDRRDELLDQITDEFLLFVAELRTLPPGWSRDEACRLPPYAKDWLDPGSAGRDSASGADVPSDASEEIIHGFANWLNSELDRNLPMGDPEHALWADALADAIKDAAWD